MIHKGFVRGLPYFYKEAARNYSEVLDLICKVVNRQESLKEKSGHVEIVSTERQVELVKIARWLCSLENLVNNYFCDYLIFSFNSLRASSFTINVFCHS